MCFSYVLVVSIIMKGNFLLLNSLQLFHMIFSFHHLMGRRWWWKDFSIPKNKIINFWKSLCDSSVHWTSIYGIKDMKWAQCVLMKWKSIPFLLHKVPPLRKLSIEDDGKGCRINYHERNFWQHILRTFSRTFLLPSFFIARSQIDYMTVNTCRLSKILHLSYLFLHSILAQCGNVLHTEADAINYNFCSSSLISLKNGIKNWTWKRSSNFFVFGIGIVLMQ